MRIRGLLIATVVFCVLAGILYWSEHHKPAEATSKASADAAPAILKLEATAIAKLEIKRKDQPPVLLAKAASGDWQITEPQPFGADQSAVTSLLSTLSSLNSERLVEDKASDLKRYGLDQPGVEVDITEKDNKTQRLLVGDDTPAGNAVYAMLAGDPRLFTLPSYDKASLDKSLNDLRDKRLLTANADKISRVELLRKNEDIEFGRDKSEWQIVKPKPLRADNFAVDELIRKLSDARMDLSGTDEATKTDSAFAQATPIATAKVTDQAGTQEIQVRKNKDIYYAKSSAVGGIYKVSSDFGQALDKNLDDFRNKKLFDFNYPDPNKVELHVGPKAYFLTRNGDDWWSNGKKMDAVSVQSLLSSLRNLTASTFPETGFTTPEIEITVTSDDGKRVEKVALAKSGNGYVARRENEPSLYQLDSSAVDEIQKAADALTPAAPPPKK